MDLYKQKSYLTSVPYYVNVPIYEYDMVQSNINLLLVGGVITKEAHEYLTKLPKLERQINIGYLLKTDPRASSVLSEGMTYYKKQLFEKNSIVDEDVISIKNDAVFVTKPLKYTEFEYGIIKFRLANTYTTYMKLQNLEIYFGSNQVTGEMIFDVKGINDEKLKLFMPGFIELIILILTSLESGDIRDTLSLAQKVYSDYVNRLYPVSYYRTFDSDAQFILTSKQRNVGYACNSEVPGMNVNHLDISRNTLILSQLYGYAVDIYNSIKK